MLRIFVCTSQINTLYMILYARKTQKEGYKDILILDSVSKKQSLIKVITGSKKIYNWSAVIDLSIPLNDENEMAPGARKKLIRKIKTNPLVKPVYTTLLKRHLAKKQKKEAAVVREKLKDLGAVHELNLLTQTMVNNTLMQLYPAARINYFEHGLGDYYFIQKIKPVPPDFYCVFADAFREYLKKGGGEAGFVKEVLEEQNFSLLASEVIHADIENEKIISSLRVPGKKVVLMLDAMEIYHVPDNYWTDYLDLCISKVENPEDYTFVLKPHHNQSARTIQISKDHILNHHKLKAVLVENSLAVNYGIEVLYSLWGPSTYYVFSVFSSALFYISKMYPNQQTNYFYAYDFFRGYIKNSPAQFVATYNGIAELVKNVFSENCTDISGSN